MHLRTIQVVNVRWFNATAWYGLQLASLLTRSGHETLTLCLPETDSFAKAREMGLNPIALPLTTTNPLEVIHLYRRISSIIGSFRPHIINCHRGEFFFLFGMLKQLGGYALVRTRGDQRKPRNNIPNRYLHQKTADAVIATNTAMTRWFTDVLNVPGNKVHTILGGVDTRKFVFDPEARTRIRAAYGLSDNDFVIGLLGRFDAVKGQQELIEAVARLAARGHANIRLLLIGFPTDTSTEEVEAWIRGSHAEGIVTITGKVPDVPGTISACDLGVVSSRFSETIARAALEMMACGLPIVSTNVGVMPDLLPPDALCAPHDAGVLADLLERAISEQPFLDRLKQHCRRLIQQLDYDHFLNDTLHVYETALSKCHGGR